MRPIGAKRYDLASFTHGVLHVATVLDKELKRQVSVDGADYTVVLDPDGFRLIGKGKRNPQVQLRWRDLLSGDAAMAVALNASLKPQPPTKSPATEKTLKSMTSRAAKKP